MSHYRWRELRLFVVIVGAGVFWWLVFSPIV